MSEVSHAFETNPAELVEIVGHCVLYLNAMRRKAFEIMSQPLGMQTAEAHSVIAYISFKHNDSLWILRNFVVDMAVILRCRLSRNPFHFVGFFTFLTRKNGHDKKEDRSCNDPDCSQGDLYRTIGDTLGNRKAKQSAKNESHNINRN